ncbi:hypothetical protein [Bradyrhizobium sp. 195]|uniref:hypothetical protein n=1 Tax=Bradyrhizobium sp. 195 TaxID=2782662 RepID=UPI0020007DFB|nr:hypothetical protein [Bradyrhizobium sp. 195]UPK30832.1 hypothetical protein IVB26_08625 [Bradyrhizobium sp. 195]
MSAAQKVSKTKPYRIMPDPLARYAARKMRVRRFAFASVEMELKGNGVAGTAEYGDLLSHHFASAVRPLREMMRIASHNNWRNIRL